MKFKRIESGYYTGGEFSIRRVLSQQTRRATEVCWVLTRNGKWMRDCDSLKDAKYFAETAT